MAAIKQVGEPVVEAIIKEREENGSVARGVCVTDENNYQKWIDNKLTPVIPRSIMQRLNIDERLKLAYNTFVSFSLQETIQLYEDGKFYIGEDIERIYSEVEKIVKRV